MSLINSLVSGGVKKLNSLKSPFRKVGFTWLDERFIKNMPDDQLNEVKLFGEKIRVWGRIGFIYAVKEIFIDEYYKIRLKKDPYIIDCGANIGLSVIYLKRAYPNARIIAFEPDEKNFELLNYNVNAFGFKNIQLKKQAVWIEETMLSFTNDGTMSSKIDSSGSHEVQAIRLKNLLDQSVDFLKIDIEGAEYPVLKDIKDSLHYVSNLFIEYHGNFNQNNELNEILMIVNEAGFSYYIKEAASMYDHPFYDEKKSPAVFDVQLNIFCKRN
ncbi:MAG: FkbM family methyltransferase [Flavitalea sp.]